MFDQATIQQEVLAQIQWDESNRDLPDEDLRNTITHMVRAKAGVGVPLGTQAAVIGWVFNQIRGLGLLDNIIADDNITEVMINGYDNIFIERSGRIARLNEGFTSEDELQRIIQRLVGKVHKEVNEANPIVDTRLLDGSRVSIVLRPISLGGPIVTIRKFSREPMTIEKLIDYGSLTSEIAQVIELLVRARYNIFICGGTGSGKTTFLNACSNFIPTDERIITIEDSAELQISRIPNLVSLEARNANASGVGEITIRDLIKTSLRMRPDRIVVGEVRGAEALDMLQAMNTGHDGSLSTGHANSTRDMLSRLETMVLQGAAGLPLAAIRQQVASGIDIIIHLGRLRDRSRKTLEIVEVAGYNQQENIIELNPLYQFEETPESTNSRVVGALLRTSNPLLHPEKLLAAGIQEVF